jgi:Fe-S cluster biogenesis protein NfuA
LDLNQVFFKNEGVTNLMKSLCKRNCNNCIFFNRCGGCSMCEASICNGICTKCDALCPRRGSAVNYLKNILNTSGDLENSRNYDIPFHIPILPDRLQEPLDNNIAPLIGVHGGNFFSNNGEKVRRIYKEKGFRRAININDRSHGILQFYVKDRTLEGIWDKRKDIYRDIEDQGFKFIIAPNFSVYEDSPRIDHLYNIQRSRIMYNEMIEQGLGAIPDVSWYNLKDIDAWIKDISKKNIKTIAFSFQVVDVKLKASNIWKHYLAGFKYFCSQLSGKYQIIIIGAASHRRVDEIRAAAPGNISIHVLNQSAYVQSQRGMASEGRISDLETPKNILLKKNITYFNDLYRDLNERKIKYAKDTY